MKEMKLAFFDSGSQLFFIFDDLAYRSNLNGTEKEMELYPLGTNTPKLYFTAYI
ncbi:hypothetical protein LOAG_16941 [Loa loa]|uniref:Uncharacterized protein n=1 Tax=Loa loa TaxID=7209 RepID=A0A1S0UMH4_LOALO|nr:hypothetical protein LOAG_16941 [Loa loa]EJD76014.1 hypothetical protein LOAG_16941 [Loa loa]